MPRKAAPAYVIGVGMTKFIKPRGKVDYTELGFEAGIKAMLDAKINYDEVDQGVACYCVSPSFSMQQTQANRDKVRRLYLRTGSFLPVRHDPNPSLQRQQQLQHWLNWSADGQTSSCVRRSRLCACGWFREDEPRFSASIL